MGYVTSGRYVLFAVQMNRMILHACSGDVQVGSISATWILRAVSGGREDQPTAHHSPLLLPRNPLKQQIAKGRDKRKKGERKLGARSSMGSNRGAVVRPAVFVLMGPFCGSTVVRLIRQKHARTTSTIRHRTMRQYGDRLVRLFFVWVPSSGVLW